MENIYKKLRKNKNLTQMQLAQLLHLDQTTVGKWELGKSIPDAVTLKSLATFYNVSIDYLLGQTDNPSPTEINYPNISAVKQTAQWLGHSNIKTTLENYVSISDDFEKINVERINRKNTQILHKNDE